MRISERQKIQIELRCNAQLRYVIRVWEQKTIRGYIDIPVTSADYGLLMIQRIMDENPEVYL